VVFLQSGPVFLTSGKREDQLRLWLRPWGVKKPDQTGPSNTTQRYAVISPPLPLSLVTPFEVSHQGMVQPYMRTLPVQVDPGGTALPSSLPLCLTPFEASHVQPEIRTQPAQYVNLERERI